MSRANVLHCRTAMRMKLRGTLLGRTSTQIGIARCWEFSLRAIYIRMVIPTPNLRAKKDPRNLLLRRMSKATIRRASTCLAPECSRLQSKFNEAVPSRMPLALRFVPLRRTAKNSRLHGVFRRPLHAQVSLSI